MIRENLIRKLVRGKNVLDIGSLGQTNKYSLWNLLTSAACKSLTGIDLPSAQKIVSRKFHLSSKDIPKDTRIVYGNMETYQFNKKFDIVIAGDVLEHVENQSLFLKNIYRHLKNNGKLLLTTPNAKWPTVFIKPNPTHTLWHDIHTLSVILDYSGFKISKTLYYPGNKQKYNPFILPFIWRQAILVICVKK